MKSNYKRLGDYIKEINVRNTGQKAEKLLGINIDSCRIYSNFVENKQ